MAVGQIEAGGFYPRFCGMYGTSWKYPVAHALFVAKEFCIV